MIIAKEKNKRAVQSHDFQSVNCTIDAEDMRYVASLLRNNYSKPILAVIREITANALDANAEASSKRSVEISIPSSLSPVFSVRDFGGGLSQEDIFGLYSKYGKSTKRDSNNYIGAFGIGKFAPLSYGNNFTCVSFHGGKKTSYDIFVNDDDDTKIIKLCEEPSSEPTGLSIEVAVADSDVEKFREEVKSFFKVFPKHELPKFKGIEDDFFPKLDTLLEGDGWFFLGTHDKYNSYSYRYSYGAKSYAIMGRVAYPIDASAIDFGDDADKLKDLIESNNFYMDFPIGALKLHHSRESLEYNKATQKSLLLRAKEVKDQIEEIAKEKLEGAKDLWEAKCNYAQVMNALPSSLQDVFRNSFSWQGTQVRSSAFERPYGMVDDLIITEYTKTDDSSATDGYKVRTQKVSRALAWKESMLVINDAPQHGLALRARTLFNENPDVTHIYSVKGATDEGQKHMTDTWEIDLILPKNRRNLSSVDKAKLKQGTRSSGESRSDVAMFSLDLDSQSHYRQADYWINEDKSSKITHKNKVYIAITAYKLSHYSWNLEGLVRKCKSIRSFDKDFKLYGVRNKDVKNLDDSWVEFTDYCKKISLQYCKAHPKAVKFTRRQKEMSDKVYKMESYRNLCNLFVNNSLSRVLRNNLCGSHEISQVFADYKSFEKFKDHGEKTNLALVSMAEEYHPKALDKIAPIVYTAQHLEDDCKRICDKYALLINISDSISSWKNMEEGNFAQNIVEYIKLVDQQNKS